MYSLYHVEEWIGTYETKLLIVLTHDSFAAEDTQPPGEEIQGSTKKKARAEAGKRATHTLDLIDFFGVGRQAFGGKTFSRLGQDTAIKYQPIGIQVCGRCGKSVYDKLSCPNQPRLKAWDEIELTVTGSH